MNRRSFLANLAAIALAPKVLDAVAALRPAPMVSSSLPTLQQAYRKMQGKLLEGFQSTTEEWDLADSMVGFGDVLQSTSVHRLRTESRSAWRLAS